MIEKGLEDGFLVHCLGGLCYNLERDRDICQKNM